MPSWFWHPLGACAAAGSHAQVVACKSYNFWSGIVGDIGEVTLIFAAVSFTVQIWMRHNCHYHRCWRLAWHIDPETGHPVCKLHHPDHPKGGGGHVGLGHPFTHEKHWSRPVTSAVIAIVVAVWVLAFIVGEGGIHA